MDATRCDKEEEADAEEGLLVAMSAGDKNCQLPSQRGSTHEGSAGRQSRRCRARLRERNRKSEQMSMEVMAQKLSTVMAKRGELAAVLEDETANDDGLSVARTVSRCSIMQQTLSCDEQTHGVRRHTHAGLVQAKVTLQSLIPLDPSEPSKNTRQARMKIWKNAQARETSYSDSSLNSSEDESKVSSNVPNPEEWENSSSSSSLSMLGAALQRANLNHQNAALSSRLSSPCVSVCSEQIGQANQVRPPRNAIPSSKHPSSASRKPDILMLLRRRASAPSSSSGRVGSVTAEAVPNTSGQGSDRGEEQMLSMLVNATSSLSSLASSLAP
eukprot:TRINITY_DN23830_c0_g2_i1.p1 TRINITY_DN23830_c0_g2~~TRINITY_DN23830_c0_g2_i1.p1  ORF type:complete len:328 (-),score=41.68 TRINITY_DN23830_c0_g2_i1:150-1133(-)